jgi:hypothetical protein
MAMAISLVASTRGLALMPAYARNLHRAATNWSSRTRHADASANMPPLAQAVRLAGDAMTDVGARRRNTLLLVAGAAVIAAGWSHPARSGTSS